MARQHDSDLRPSIRGFFQPMVDFASAPDAVILLKSLAAGVGLDEEFRGEIAAFFERSLSTARLREDMGARKDMPGFDPSGISKRDIARAFGAVAAATAGVAATREARKQGLIGNPDTPARRRHLSKLDPDEWVHGKGLQVKRQRFVERNIRQARKAGLDGRTITAEIERLEDSISRRLLNLSKPGGPTVVDERLVGTSRLPDGSTVQNTRNVGARRMETPAIAKERALIARETTKVEGLLEAERRWEDLHDTRGAKQRFSGFFSPDDQRILKVLDEEDAAHIRAKNVRFDRSFKKKAATLLEKGLAPSRRLSGVIDDAVTHRTAVFIQADKIKPDLVRHIKVLEDGIDSLQATLNSEFDTMAVTEKRITENAIAKKVAERDDLTLIKEGIDDIHNPKKVRANLTKHLPFDQRLRVQMINIIEELSGGKGGNLQNRIIFEQFVDNVLSRGKATAKAGLKLGGKILVPLGVGLGAREFQAEMKRLLEQKQRALSDLEPAGVSGDSLGS